MNNQSLPSAFTPVRADWLSYGRQSIGKEEIEAVTQVLRSNRLTQGPVVELFEQKFARSVSARFAVAFSNGTEALVAAHRALGISDGDQTLTVSMTFAATSNAALLVGARPIFSDIEPDTGLMDPALLEKSWRQGCKAIVPVHYAGSVCDMDRINQFAKSRSIAVIEDACHAFGATYNNRPAGSLSDIGIFSFHPVKPITTAEGGMAVTDNEGHYRRLKSLATHGIEKDQACEAVGPWFYEMRHLASNARLSDLHAALGLAQLKKADSFLLRRRQLASEYDRHLAENTIFQPLRIPKGVKSAYHLYPVLVRTDRLTCDKKRLVEAFHAMNIGVQVHYIPVHSHPYYRGIGYDDSGLETTLQFYEQVVSMPLFATMTDSDQQDVFEALKRIEQAYGN